MGLGNRTEDPGGTNEDFGRTVGKPCQTKRNSQSLKVIRFTGVVFAGPGVNEV